jgi:PncC family amidohydrolase
LAVCLLLIKIARLREREHIAVDQINIAAFLGRDAVHVLHFTDIVGAHPAVLPGGCVTGHTALVVAAQQAVKIELNKKRRFLRGQDKGLLKALFPAHHPWVKGIFHEFQGLLLDVGEAGLFKVTHHMGRHPEDTGDLVDLEFPCLQELRLFRGDADGLKLHAFLQHCHAMGVTAALVGAVPTVLDPLDVFDYTGMLQYSAESCTGGLLGKILTDLPGSSAYFWGGVISYSNEAKQRLLGVSQDLLENFGAVSRECAEAMVRGLVHRSGTDLGVAITGIAGPSGGSEEKPVGLVYIAVLYRDSCTIKEVRLGGQRDMIRMLAAKSALDTVRRILMDEER